MFNFPMQEELRKFHEQHFGRKFVGSLFHQFEDQNTEQQSAEEDYGLGHYPDGTKRTLTDDEIAILRHSEIEAMLRKKRNQQANPDSQDENESEFNKVTSEAQRNSAKSLSVESNPVDRHKPEDFQSEEQPGLTHRRIARELDEVKVTSVELDY